MQPQHVCHGTLPWLISFSLDVMPWPRFALISVAILASVAAAGCACSAWTGPRTIAGPAEQTLCAMHHVPIVTSRGYRAREDASILMTSGWYQAARCYPNHISPRISLRSGGKVFITPTTVHYCPVCEQELAKEADRLE
jgi:hypothetical protein